MAQAGPTHWPWPPWRSPASPTPRCSSVRTLTGEPEPLRHAHHLFAGPGTRGCDGLTPGQEGHLGSGALACSWGHWRPGRLVPAHQRMGAGPGGAAQPLGPVPVTHPRDAPDSCQCWPEDRGHLRFSPIARSPFGPWVPPQRPWARQGGGQGCGLARPAFPGARLGCFLKKQILHFTVRFHLAKSISVLRHWQLLRLRVSPSLPGAESQQAWGPRGPSGAGLRHVLRVCGSWAPEGLGGEALAAAPPWLRVIPSCLAPTVPFSSSLTSSPTTPMPCYCPFLLRLRPSCFSGSVPTADI